jgi:hypothetical protein
MIFRTTTFLTEQFTPRRDEKSAMKATPSCRFCSSSEQNLLRCGACKVVRYCSKDHQALDRPEHVSVCKSITKCAARMNQEEVKLRNQPEGDMFAPANVFEKHVGHFWGMHNTRPYMRARFALVEAILQVRTRDAVATALEHVMDCFRLCRLDNMGLRDLAPALMLRLDKDQECYDFVKWYATTGRRDDYDWGDMQQPFLDIKNADIMESPKYLSGYHDLSHLVSIAFIKIRLLIAVRGVSEEVLQSSPSFEQAQRVEDVVAILKSHVNFLYRTIDKANVHLWPALLSPQSHLDARPPYQSHGSREEMQMVLKHNYDAWKEFPGATDVVKAIMHKLDY